MTDSDYEQVKAVATALGRDKSPFDSEVERWIEYIICADPLTLSRKISEEKDPQLLEDLIVRTDLSLSELRAKAPESFWARVTTGPGFRNLCVVNGMVMAHGVRDFIEQQQTNGPRSVAPLMDRTPLLPRDLRASPAINPDSALAGLEL